MIIVAYHSKRPHRFRYLCSGFKKDDSEIHEKASRSLSDLVAAAAVFLNTNP